MIRGCYTSFCASDPTAYAATQFTTQYCQAADTLKGQTGVVSVALPKYTGLPQGGGTLCLQFIFDSNRSIRYVCSIGTNECCRTTKRSIFRCSIDAICWMERVGHLVRVCSLQFVIYSLCF